MLGLNKDPAYQKIYFADFGPQNAECKSEIRNQKSEIRNVKTRDPSIRYHSKKMRESIRSIYRKGEKNPC